MLEPRTRLIVTSIVLGSLSSLAAAAGPSEFADPVRLVAGGDFVKVEGPGFAAPSWVDLDGDGLDDLVVGQFAGGKMKVYRGTEGGFATGQWLMAEGEIAEVPGVW